MKSISAPLLLILLVVLCVNRVMAQASLASLDAKTFTDNVPSIQRGDRSFTIEPSYVLKDMTAGHSVKFTITITAPSTGSSSHVMWVPAVLFLWAGRHLRFAMRWWSPAPLQSGARLRS